MLNKYTDFLLESVINNDVKKITELIYNEFILRREEFEKDSKLTLHNVLSKNYKDILFDNDKLEFILSDKYHSYVRDCDIYGVLIFNSDVVFEIPYINEVELKSEITHEFTHIIQKYYSKNELSKDWDIYKRLKSHQKRWSKYDVWINISHLFYETLDMEMDSRAAETYQHLKVLNTKDYTILQNHLLQTKEWKNMNDILKINPDDIVKMLQSVYPHRYEFILKDFMYNVLHDKYSVNNFIREINRIKTKCQQQKKRLSKLITEFSNEGVEFIEEHIEKVNYSQYLDDILSGEHQRLLEKKKIRESRNKKIKRLF